MTASKQDLFSRLAELGIKTETFEHEAAHTVEQARHLRGEIAGGHCKNLFLKDKKGQLWLIVCLEDAQIDLKKAPAQIDSARLSFGKAELLEEALGVKPGSVTPFALINDKEHIVNVILDATMMNLPILNFHPLENTATTSIAAQDLLKFIESCGHQPEIVDLSS